MGVELNQDYNGHQISLREGFNKKTLKVMEFSILGGEGGGLPDFHNFFWREKKS